jgi:hypothetical protein
MDDTTPINARPQGRLSEAVEDAGLAVREHVVWPVEDRAYSFGIPGGAIAGVAAVVLAVAIGVGGLALIASGGSSGRAATTEVAKTVPKTQPGTPTKAEPVAKAPTLHGAAPVFKPEHQGSGSKLADSKPIESAPPPAHAAATGSAAADTISSTPSAQAASAGGGNQDPEVAGPPAGPKAVAVAREFAGAFVVYETGGQRAEFRKGFTQTASPDLTKALLHRPPRQPAGVEVPRAKVLNVVTAPSHGSVYPVSVSLLRVGVTSELRLEMEQLKNQRWRVTNVLG